MFLNIIKKDLKRKKVMNFILLSFIILATIFVSSGLNNLFAVLNGTDAYFDKAGIGNFNMITVGDNSTGNMAGILDKEDYITKYKIDSVIFPSENTLFNGNHEKIKVDNSAIIQSIDSTKINIFDKDNKIVNKVDEGHVYLSGNIMKKNDLKVGDTIIFEKGNVKLQLTIDGRVKDAFLGSEFFGNSRLLINEKDKNKILKDDDIKKHYLGEIAYIESSDLQKMQALSSKIPGISFSGPRSMIKLCYVMDMILALIILILSICLIIVSFVVLKFSINFTISEEYREIGVMKAVGIKNRSIRRIYIFKYLALAIVGSIIGLIASIPLGNVFMKSATENMVLESNSGYLINVIGAIIVILLIILFAYSCTRKIKKLSPIDAIRSGQTGKRYVKKTRYRIGDSKFKTSFFMAINDILSSPRRFMTIILTFFITTLFVLLLVNTTETINSDKLINAFGARSDLYISGENLGMSKMNTTSREEVKKYLDDEANKLKEMGMPSKISNEILYKYKVIFKGKEFSLNCQQGVNISSKDYKYKEGSSPLNKNEIAITPLIKEMTGAKIGDTMTIDFGNEKLDCLVVSYFESLNMLGEIIILHEDAPTSMQNVVSFLQFKVNFKDSPTNKVIEERKEKLKELYNNEKVMNAKEYCIDSLKISGALKAVQFLLLGITFLVVALVTILMEMSFITDEKSQIAILKAIGFKNKDILKWHVYRFLIVSTISVLLAALVSIPVTKLVISPLFGMMGASHFDLNIVPLKIFGLYPLMIIFVTFMVSFITGQYIRTIKSSDTANIE